MRTFCGAALLIAVTIAPPVATAQLGQWTAHTSMRRVTGLTVAGDELWASSTGGVFRMVREGGIVGTLTAVEGLHAVAVSTLLFDAERSAVWLGYSDGVIDRIDTEDETITSFLDISRATQYTRRAINRIVVHGDSLLVCTDFGIVVFDAKRGEVRDAYSRFGSFDAGVPVFDVVVAPDPQGGESFWVATDVGVATAPVDSRNLQDPAQWTTELPPVASLRSVAFRDGRLYLGTIADVYVREADASYSPLGLTGATVHELDAVEDLLIGGAGSEIFVIHPDGATSIFAIQGFPNPRAVRLVDGQLWIGDFGGGVTTLEIPAPGTKVAQEAGQRFLPAGPYDGVFLDLYASVDGTLWAGGLLGGGFHRLSPDGTWTDFVAPFFEELTGRGSYTSVSSDASGTGWAASEGQGVAQVAEDGSINVFDESNSSLRAVTGFPGFIIVGGVAGDSEGGIWVTTRGSPTPIHYHSPDGTWTGLPPMVGEGLTAGATAYGKIFIDSFGQKWIVVREESSFGNVKGLAVLDTGTSPTDPADDSFRFFGARGGGGQGLPTKAVTAIAEDRDGLIWIGTQEGLAFFVNTGVVARDPNALAIWPQRADRSGGVFLFLGLPVNDLAVDPANRLWIATNDGVRLIQAVEGGYEEVLHLTSDNSPLLSDVVLAVEILAGRGTAFLATAEGLVSVEIDAVTAATSVDDLLVYPNPAVISDGVVGSITVQGLVDETRMSIVSPLGEVVATMSTRGGRAVWDLRDESGRLVPSGVYMVIAVGENGEGTAFGKVAVIK